ncbi:MAG: hypothetical protein ACOCUU_01060 [Nanoarchaeota archaeon]
MKEKKLIYIVFILLLSSFLLNNISALSGVSPASYEIDFEPNLKKDFEFTFVFDEDLEQKVEISGSLKDYVKVNKDTLSGGKNKVIASLSLPGNIEVPGTHRIRIGAESIGQQESGLSLSPNAGGIIKVNVPYPGKYAETSLKTSNANVGEDIDIELTVYSKGNQDITVKPVLEISNSEKIIEKINLETKKIPSGKKQIFEKTLDTSEYTAGDYNITAIVDYGGKDLNKKSTLFRLGEFYVGLSNYTRLFEKDKINRMTLEVESFWNNVIENVYADIKILETGETTTTPSLELKPWKKDTRVGFFDTTGIEDEPFHAEITIHYNNQTTTETVDLRFKKEFNYTLVIIVASLLILISLITIIIFLLLRNKHGKK